ncbi:MAG: ABC transporter permease, partial [Flavipsychrobacter sp.]|nr:ABC transporter permease [Flavipsychrobacter sp.]
MNRMLIWQIALRYFAGKRKANVVPILSRISMVAIAVSSAAMIIVFSVFNGLEGVVKDLYKGFYPDIKISA